MRIKSVLSSLALFVIFIFSTTAENNGGFPYGRNINNPTATAAQIQPSLITTDSAVKMTQLTSLKREQVTQLAWSPDGKILAVAGLSGVRLYDTRTLVLTPSQLISSNNRIRRVAFNQDGTLLTTATADVQASELNIIELWNVPDGKHQIRFQEDKDTPYEGIPTSVVFSPDGTLVASGDWGNVVRLWDVKTGMQKSILWGHMQPVWSVAFDATGNVLASASADGTVRLWDVGAQTEITVLHPGSDNILCVVFAPGDSLMATGDQDGTIQLWDVTNLKNPKEIASLKGHTDALYNLVFNRDGTVLASASVDGTVRLWNVQTKVEIAVLRGHTGNVYSIAFSPDGTLLASGGDDGIIIWHVAA